MSLTLDVAVSTYQPEGILKVEKMIPSPKEGVRYIVSWQEHRDATIPQSLLDRNDVEIYRFDVKGLSNNRNNALDHCRGDIVLIADDDLIYAEDFADKIIQTFESDSTLDLATFKIDFLNPKTYPPSDCRLSLPLPKDYYGSSIELAFRRKSLQGLYFWEKMGLGNSLLQCGEDELFLTSAIKRGLNCKFINKKIAVHPEGTTGNRVKPGILRGQGFIIRHIYPGSFPLRIILKAWRLSRNSQAAFLSSLFHLNRGAFISLTSHIPPQCR